MESQNGIQYEVISKSIPETPFLVTEMRLGLKKTTAVTAIGHIEFDTDSEGNYTNEHYTIRQVGTQLTPNDDAVVTDEAVEVPVSHEVAVDIINGEVNPDTVVAPVEEAVVTDEAVEVPVSHEVAVDIINGEVNPDTVVAPVEEAVVTDEAVEVPVSHEVAVDIINGEVNPDTVVAPVEEAVAPVETEAVV